MSEATPTWRDLLMTTAAAIGISVGCAWAIGLIASESTEQQLQKQINAINARLNARWRDLEPKDE